MSSDGPLDDARANAAELLRGLEVFGYPEGEQLAALVEAVEWLYVPAGQRVFSTGDPPDGMYVILSGRVRFFAETTDGPVLTAEVGAGISFGEGSLLVGGGRSRTAVVVRDALLARLAPERVLDTMRTSPELAMWIARMLAARVAFEYEPPPSSLAAETTVLVPLGSAVPEARGFAADLAAAAHARACRAADLAANIGVVEADGGGLIVVADQTDPFSLTEAVRQADRIIVVASAREPPRRRGCPAWTNRASISSPRRQSSSSSFTPPAPGTRAGRPRGSASIATPAITTSAAATGAICSGSCGT